MATKEEAGQSAAHIILLITGIGLWVAAVIMALVNHFLGYQYTAYGFAFFPVVSQLLWYALIGLGGFFIGFGCFWKYPVYKGYYKRKQLYRRAKRRNPLLGR